MNTYRWIAVAFLLVVVLAFSGTTVSGTDAPVGARWSEGTLFIAWGTAQSNESASTAVAAGLRHDDGSATNLDLSPEQLAALGGPMMASGARVRALLVEGEGLDGLPVRPLEIHLAGRKTAGIDASGSYPYVSLMCAFSDISLPPEGLPYFQNMYANSWPGLDHYWRRQSYGMVDVVGSTAAGWFTLPHTRSHYTDMISGSDYSTMLSALHNDCTGVASSSVNLSDYVGVNLMFNETFGPYAWGGWGGVTWEPPWGWHNIAVIGHEMGHAFGLPHSNNADGDGSPYDNPWDIMSNSWGSALSDPTYGTVGKHTITYHKNSLGWIPAARRAEVSTGGFYTFDIDHLTYAGTSNLHMVQVQIPGSSRFYTIEVRDRVGYDGNLQGFAVILHEVDQGRQEPAWLVDPDFTDNGSGPAVMWLPGECFDDETNEILICVDSVITEGYRVEVAYGSGYTVFKDDFESGGTGNWSSVVQ
jgi:hypothetical protein